MYMKQVEVLVLYNTHHLAGEGQFIRGIFEKRVRPEVDLVIVEVLIQEVEPAWLTVRDKMNFMAFFGKRFPELSGYDAATAEGWITNNS
jgi:hypothetical protein